MRHHIPLHSYKNPRRISGGRSPYIFRREAGVDIGFDQTPRRFPTLYVTEKIRHKAGLVFYNCPHFKHLRESDIPNRFHGSGGSESSKQEMEDLTSKGRLRIKTLDKKSEEIDKKKKKLKQKRRGKKNDPSIKKVREHLRKIIKYHEHKVNEEIPSIYPILGPANSDSEDGGFNSDKEDKSHTKRERSGYDPNKK
jgi:hypothetical protein